jgi:monoamine oxidase
MKRRFWEEDEAIYGGITFTDLPIQQIAYPNTSYNKPGKGVLLGTFAFGDPALSLTGMSPRVASSESGRVWCADPSAICHGV